MDLIAKCALAYQSLCEKEYYITLGRKNNTVSLHLIFTPDEFHHLAGLHKLNDIYSLRSAKSSRIWQDCIRGKLTDDTLKKSTHYQFSLERQQCVIALEQMLDGDDLYFKFNDTCWSGGRVVSKIQAEYLIEFKSGDKTVYLFVDKLCEDYICCSIFPKSQNDYSANQKKLTLLWKEKLDKATGQTVCLYSRKEPQTIIQQ